MIDYFFRCANWPLLPYILPVYIIILLTKWKLFSPFCYRYSLVETLIQAGFGRGKIFLYFTHFLRAFALVLLAVLALQPQLVDRKSELTIEGISIMLVLDASGSMQFKDYDDQQKSRFDIAKQEAIRFIDLRTNDAIGLVVFGNDALSRCPITADKKILKKMISELAIGFVDPDGTVLGRAILTASNRLKNDTAKSKVLILLTDGEPSEQDIDIKMAINVARSFGIKIYTIGIGSEDESVMMHPLYGIIQKPKVNTQLLQLVAQETGGQFFMAHNTQDMRNIYQTIDKLEKTKFDIPLFSSWYELIVPFGILILILLALELVILILMRIIV